MILYELHGSRSIRDNWLIVLRRVPLSIHHLNPTTWDSRDGPRFQKADRGNIGQFRQLGTVMPWYGLTSRQ